jgi:hypothetical protein
MKKLDWFEFTYNVRRWFGRTQPFKAIKEAHWWIKYRTTHKYNEIKVTSLKPGYYDADHVLTHAIFDLLVQFIEFEQAWQYFCCNKEELAKVPWYMTEIQYCKKHGRELGLEALEKDIELRMDLDDNGCQTQGDLQINHEMTQGWCSKEMKEVYLWYKDIYLKHDQEKRFWAIHNRKISIAERLALEKFYTDEETEMLIRVIKVRQALWT